MNSIDADAFDTDEDRFGPQEDQQASGPAIGTVVNFRLPGQRKTRRGSVSRVQDDGALIVEHRITERTGGSRRAYTRVLPSQVVTETAH